MQVMGVVESKDSVSGKVKTCIRRCEGYEIRCRQLSETYGLPVADDIDERSFDYGLEFDRGILVLRDIKNPRFRPIRMSTRELSGMSRKSHLGRAVGKKVTTIVDGTAGLGADAILMARMGYRVVAVERSPVFAALIEDGIFQLEKSPVKLSINLRFGDLQSVLPKIKPPPDAVYLDPMFPEGRKPSVKVVRPLAVLRAICDDDSDIQNLFDAAIEHATRRVIVKRPNFADPVRPDRLSMSVQGKLVRYDIYLATK